jgi:hypothetical protein
VGLLCANPDELAFESLLEVRGELVTFREQRNVAALIDRNPTQNLSGPRGPIEVSTLVKTVVQLRRKTTRPEIGESVTDRFGVSHRFIKVSHFGHCWNCESEAA